MVTCLNCETAYDCLFLWVSAILMGSRNAPDTKDKTVGIFKAHGIVAAKHSLLFNIAGTVVMVLAKKHDSLVMIEARC